MGPYVLLGLQHPPILGVSLGLSRRQKWAFYATNLPYWALAFFTSQATSVPSSPFASCFSGLCSSVSFYTFLFTLLAFVSTYWHGAQCQLLDWLYCHALHSPKWLMRLVKIDVSCSLFTFCVGLGCVGPWRTGFWLAVPFAFFCFSRSAKKRGAYLEYAIGHGVWHILSAVAMWQILFNVSMPPWQRAADSVDSGSAATLGVDVLADVDYAASGTVLHFRT